VKRTLSATARSVPVHLSSIPLSLHTFFSFLCVFLLWATGCGTVAPVFREPSEGEKTTVRVAVLREAREFTLESENAVLIHNSDTEKLPSEINITVEEECVRIGNHQYLYPARIKSDNPFVINGKKYYGDLRFIKGLVFNEVPLEVYLQGVVASEVAEDWPEEALKAQAVVSRTYVYGRILSNRDGQYDIEDTEMHQKYVYTERAPRIADAVSATEGLVILYEGSLIEAFFHSSSGGLTENCGDVFQRDIPYLRAFPDPYSVDNEYFLWQYSIEGKNIAYALDLGNGSMPLTDIRIGRKTGSGRVSHFILEFNGKEHHIVKGNSMRLLLGPKDFKSLFLLSIDKMKKEGDSVYTFTGRGYGHGVGMSQLGAREMAYQGFSFDQIIAFYYRGSRLDNYRFSSNG
jgi:stage II sporulation protein D